MTVNMLCIRDPDWENTYVYDAPVNEITIDIGGMWESYKDFVADLKSGGEAVMYMEDKLEEVAGLDPENPVRQAVEEFFEEAKK